MVGSTTDNCKKYVSSSEVAQNYFLSRYLKSTTISIENILALILVALSAITLCIAQIQFSALDDNRLLSWRWLVDHNNETRYIIAITAALAGALILVWLKIKSSSALAYLLMLSVTISILCWQVPEAIVDNSRYFTHAKIIETQGFEYFVAAWGTHINVWTDLPLISIIYGFLFKLTGEHRMVIQLANTVFFSGAIYLTYAIGRELWDKNMGLLAGYLLLAIPYLHIQTAFMLVDVGTMTFFCLALWLSIMALKRQNTILNVAASGVIAMVMLSKFSAWLIVPVVLCLPLAFDSNKLPRNFTKALYIITGVMLFLTVLLTLSQLNLYHQIELLLNYQWTGLHRWQESPISTFFFQTHPFVSLAAIFSLFLATKRRDKKYFAIAWPILFLVFAGVNRARYLILVYPMLALMAAYAVYHCGAMIVQKYYVATAVIVALLSTLILSIPFLNNSSANNLKLAGHYINSLAEGRVIVVALP